MKIGGEMGEIENWGKNEKLGFFKITWSIFPFM